MTLILNLVCTGTSTPKKHSCTKQWIVCCYFMGVQVLRYLWVIFRGCAKIMPPTTVATCIVHNKMYTDVS